MKAEKTALSAPATHYSIFILLLLAGALSAVLAWHANPSDSRWFFDAIEGISQLAVDDAYRFFESRGVLQHRDLWSWAYLLPVDAVFKGILHALTNSNIFLMRIAHVSVNLVGAYCLYRSCLVLGVNSFVAAGASASILFMPLYIAVSMSFYGEGLLTAFSAFAIYRFLKSDNNQLVLLAALMPLIQLQGLFLISGYFLFYFTRKSWGRFLALAAPGFLYFLYVMKIHGGVFEYLSFTQLHKLYPALPVPIQERGWQGAFITLNPAWLAASIVGALLVWRKVWAFYTGTLVWFLMVAFIMSYYNGYEPRYLLPCLPAFALTYAVALNAVLRPAAHWIGKRAASALVTAFVLLLILENAGQSDPVRANYLGDRRWPIGKPHTGAPLFVEIKSNAAAHGQDIANRVHTFFSHNEDYRLLVVNQHRAFYFLDRSKLPDNVTVAYTPFEPVTAYPAFGGIFAVLSPDHPQMAFLRFKDGTDRSDNGIERGVFIGDFSFIGWRAAYENREYAAYEVAYKHDEPPEKIRIIHRMDESKSNQGEYKTKNLCPNRDGFVCPDWRKWNVF